jgi:hypothetical protein
MRNLCEFENRNQAQTRILKLLFPKTKEEEEEEKEERASEDQP